MKKSAIAASLFALTIAMSGCQKSKQKVNTRLPEKAKAEQSDGLKIAFVEIDSIMTQYEFCKEFSSKLEKKSERMKATLTQRGMALQKAAQEFQQKAQQNAYTQETGRAAQEALEKQQAALQQLQEKLQNDLATETGKYNQALRDSVVHFLADYNKTHGYSIILSKAGDNILLAEQSMDITEDVIAGLNKRYKNQK